tara:strand:- start:1446 stop:1745 length:300 start_codon:yes stop_codon:yes gene_type:complete
MRAGTIPSLELSASKLWVINFYQDQLDKFEKLGLGQETENGVTITEELILSTKKRLSQLAVVYERNTSKAALYQRVYNKARKDNALNGYNNGSITNTRK